MTGHTRSAADGITNETLMSNLATHMTIAAFTAIAWYNVVELNIVIYMGFKRKKGLYFWSLVLSTQGILLHSLAFILKFYGLVTQYEVTCAFVTVGWYLMVTGQSLVLYSRLNLIVREPWIVRAVLIMIIWNAVTLHIPTTVLTFGSNSAQPDRFTSGFRIMEMIQMTIFSVQELIISATYIWATIRFLRPVYNNRVQSVMIQLLWINVAIILMDLAMLTMEYLGYYSIQVSMKAAIYSVKLKLEFTVLNQLILLSKPSHSLSFGLEQPGNELTSRIGSSQASQTSPSRHERWRNRFTSSANGSTTREGNTESKTTPRTGHIRSLSACENIETEVIGVSASPSRKTEDGCRSFHISDVRGL